MPPVRVIPVKEVVILDFGGFQIQVSPVNAQAGRRGRKPSPATQAIISAMEQDHAAGRPKTRQDYLAMLRRAGHKGSPASASLIITREARRIFGGKLARSSKKQARKGRTGGRKPSPATALLREQLAKDKANGSLRDATHYVRWLADKANLGLRRARPLVYRELRAVR